MTGWSVWSPEQPWEYLDAGQTPAWDCIDAITAASGLTEAMEQSADFRHVSHRHIDPSLVEIFRGWTLLLCEDWALYPDPKQPGKLVLPAWDKCLTARYIGAYEALARLTGRRIILQGAKIKSRALELSAAETFLRPLHDNRHANDSMMHWHFYAAKEGLLHGSTAAAP